MTVQCSNVVHSNGCKDDTKDVCHCDTEYCYTHTSTQKFNVADDGIIAASELKVCGGGGDEILLM